MGDMMNTMIKNEEKSVTIKEIRDLEQTTNVLFESGHYKKLGKSGIFAVVQMAKSIGIDVFQALNGGLYYIDGKIEMDGRLMMALIRKAGHSITKDKKSDHTVCIMHGKRADTGDMWTESFSIEDAKLAGLLTRGVWQKYGKDMLQWRALSRLARFLFPDVIKEAYIMGEISEAPKLNAKVDLDKEEEIATKIRQGEEVVIVEPALEPPCEPPQEAQAPSALEICRYILDNLEIEDEGYLETFVQGCIDKFLKENRDVDNEVEMWIKEPSNFLNAYARYFKRQQELKEKQNSVN